MSYIDLIIKIIRVIYDLFTHFRVTHTPESTGKETSAKGKALNDIKEIECAIVKNNIDNVNILFNRLRSDIELLGVSTDTGVSREGTGSDTIQHGNTPARQRVLSGVGSVDIRSVQTEQNTDYAPPGVPRRTETNRVIFHHSDSDFGDAKLIHKWHKERGFICIGYHYVIPKKGHFQHGRKLQLRGAHTKGKNFDSVGVCIIGKLQKDSMTNSQECEAMRIYHDLCRAYGKELEIEFHHEECPGKHLNRETFVKMLKAAI